MTFKSKLLLGGFLLVVIPTLFIVLYQNSQSTAVQRLLYNLELRDQAKDDYHEIFPDSED